MKISEQVIRTTVRTNPEIKNGRAASGVTIKIPVYSIKPKIMNATIACLFIFLVSFSKLSFDESIAWLN